MLAKDDMQNLSNSLPMRVKKKFLMYRNHGAVRGLLHEKRQTMQNAKCIKPNASNIDRRSEDVYEVAD